MKIDILTIFPESFSYLSESIIKRAQEGGLVEIIIHNLRDWSESAHKNVDDKPFGGGAGMVMQVEPIYKAIRGLQAQNSGLKTKVLLTSASGSLWTQKKAQDYSEKIEHLIIICGHYEGVDYRVVEYLVDEEISIGNYVLSGGELPAQVMIDSIVRLLPGVLGNPASLQEESHSKQIKREYPHYTRPAVFTADNGEEWRVPDILLSGDHAKIQEWREKKAKKQEETNEE